MAKLKPVRRAIFRTALKMAARDALKEGKITQSEFYALSDMIARPRRKTPDGVVDLIGKAEDIAIENMHAAGISVGAIDWTNWKEKLIEWLPTIIKILLMLVAL
jgi:hypothetical protein